MAVKLKIKLYGKKYGIAFAEKLERRFMGNVIFAQGPKLNPNLSLFKFYETSFNSGSAPGLQTNTLPCSCHAPNTMRLTGLFANSK